ncbi:hypothetical protein [Sinorhizobium fredii]|uniref:hypothetical protein n=1 Tax=Rhizobium fredii TaxID=380 RepID=UPI0035115C36
MSLFEITRKDGSEPCGECHIQPGETCDICGARNTDDGSSDQTFSQKSEVSEKSDGSAGDPFKAL